MQFEHKKHACFKNTTLLVAKRHQDQYYNVVGSAYPILVYSRDREIHGDLKAVHRRGATVPLRLYEMKHIFINAYGIQVGVNLGTEVIDVESYSLDVCFVMPEAVELPNDYKSNGHTLASDIKLVDGNDFIILHQTNQASKLHYVKPQLTWEI